MRPIRILHLRKSQGLYGAERVILSLSKYLKDQGHKPIIGCLYDLRAPSRELADAGMNLGICTEVVQCRSQMDLKTLKDLIRLVQSYRIHLIHCHGFKADIYGWLVSQWIGTPVVATKHGWTHANSRVRFWESLDKRFLKSFHAVTPVSDPIRTTLLSV